MNKKQSGVSTTEIYSYIAKHSTLSVIQVRECFELYAKLVQEMIYSSLKPDDLFIVLPYLGRFTLAIRKGKKKGFVYRYYDFQDKDKIAEKMVEKDEADIEKLVFKVRDNIQRNLKNKCETRTRNGK